METIGGDRSNTGLVMKKAEKKSSTSIGASLTRTTGKKRRATTITSLSTWVSFCYTKPMPWRLSTCHICNMQALYFMWVCACARLQQIKWCPRPDLRRKYSVLEYFFLNTRTHNLCVRYSYSYSMYAEFMSTSVYFSIYTVKTNLFVVHKMKLT